MNFLPDVSKYIKTIIILLPTFIFYVFDFIDLLGVIFSFFYFICCYTFSFNKRSILNTIIGILIFVLSISLFIHLIDGFNNILVFEDIKISDKGIPYSLYLNFDKLIVAFYLLCYCTPKPSTIPRSQYIRIFTILFIVYVFSISIALFTGLVEFDFKIGSYFIYWFLINLFITVFAEEAFFRGFVQSIITASLKSVKYNQRITIVLSGLLFGTAHFPAGITYVSIATILGCSYAYVYIRTGNIYVPIIGHFMFNLIHFVFFTYPFVAQV